MAVDYGIWVIALRAEDGAVHAEAAAFGQFMGMVYIALKTLPLPKAEPDAGAAAFPRFEYRPCAAEFEDSRSGETAGAAEYFIAVTYGDGYGFQIVDVEAADVHLPVLQLADAYSVIGNLRVLGAEAAKRDRFDAARSAVILDAHPRESSEYFRQFLCPAALDCCTGFNPQRRCRQGYRMPVRKHFSLAESIGRL